MDEKILTISIAAYNVEEYIRQALESCLVPEIKRLEVIVVDDGATDRTMSIVDEFVSLYPDTFVPIRKENGGYGTTINASLQCARGEWFRPLDGDDWFDSKVLSTLLRELQDCPAEMAINPFVVRQPDTSKWEIIEQAPTAPAGLQEFCNDTVPGLLSMHAVTYRTSLLRECALELPPRRLYTDTLYNIWALPSVKTCWISHAPLYQYRLGRDGQSMSRSSMIAHLDDMEELVNELSGHFSKTPEHSPARNIIAEWFSYDARSLYNLLVTQPPSHRYYERLLSLQNLASTDGKLENRLTTICKSWKLFSKVNTYSEYWLFSKAYRSYLSARGRL